MTVRDSSLVTKKSAKLELKNARQIRNSFCTLPSAAERRPGIWGLSFWGLSCGTFDCLQGVDPSHLPSAAPAGSACGAVIPRAMMFVTKKRMTMRSVVGLSSAALLWCTALGQAAGAGQGPDYRLFHDRGKDDARHRLRGPRSTGSPRSRAIGRSLGGAS